MIKTQFFAWISAVALCLTVASGCSQAPALIDLPLEEAMATTLLTLDLQGHRGARGLRPESTLPGFEVALDLRVTTLEFDLHLSKDGVPVVWHDPYISSAKCAVDPMATSAVPNPATLAPDDPALLVANLTVEELRSYVCDRNPDPERFSRQSRVPTALAGVDFRIRPFSEVLDFVKRYADAPSKTAAQRASAAKIRFNVESKRVEDHPEYIGDEFDGEAPGAFERAILAVVGEHGILDRFTFQSFDHRSLWAARVLEPALTLAALTEEAPDPDDFEDWVAQGASLWSPDHETLTPKLMAEARAAGLRVIPWTLNDEASIQRAMDLGVHGIISDRPDVMIRVARSKSGSRRAPALPGL
jgi:glycerophosphoryl diester phosphodiesterase